MTKRLIIKININFLLTNQVLAKATTKNVLRDLNKNNANNKVYI